MRELKFRAWIESLNVMAEVLDIDFEKKQVLLKGYKRDTWATFNQVILMQYTGLKDKNGVEMNDGSVVKNSENEIGYIAFLQQEMGYVVVYEDCDERLGHRNTGSSYDQDHDLEVIGNIYEHPHLLKENINEKR